MKEHSRPTTIAAATGMPMAEVGAGSDGGDGGHERGKLKSVLDTWRD